MTPDQVRKLTLYQLRLISSGYERAEKVSRYKRMSPEVKEIAKKIQRQYRTF